MFSGAIHRKASSSSTGVTPKTTFIASQTPVTSPRMEVSPGEQEKLCGAIFVWVHHLQRPSSSVDYIVPLGDLRMWLRIIAWLIWEMVSYWTSMLITVFPYCYPATSIEGKFSVSSSALLFSASSTGKVFRCLRDGGNGSLAMIWGDHSSWLAWKRFSIPPRRAGGNDEEKVSSSIPTIQMQLTSIKWIGISVQIHSNIQP